MGTGLTAAELTQIRADIEDNAMPDTCNILSVTRTSDSQGGFTETWGTATASVIARFDAESGQELLQSGEVRPYMRWTVTVPWNTTVAETNRIEKGSQQFSIISIKDDRSWLATKRISVEEVI